MMTEKLDSNDVAYSNGKRQLSAKQLEMQTRLRTVLYMAAPCRRRSNYTCKSFRTREAMRILPFALD
jgi:hypothetical protein